MRVFLAGVLLLGASAFAADPSFQLERVALSMPEPDVLEVAFTAKGPISPEAALDGWYCVCLDLDGDPATGKAFRGLGCDLILRIEPIRHESCWTGVADVTDPSKPFPIEVISTVVQGNAITAQFRSDVFRKHPSFLYRAVSAEQGKAVDTVPAGNGQPPLRFPSEKPVSKP